jgi:hypothetical protein
MKQMHWRGMAAFLTLAATIGASDGAGACQRAAKAAWMANAAQARIATRDDAACPGAMTPNADEASAIPPRTKFTGGTRR